MPVSQSLRRLLKLRDLEEEQRKQALDGALGELGRLENALKSACARERAGRQRIAGSLPDVTDRVAGVVEAGMAQKQVTALKPRVAGAESEAARLRQQYLDKRVERRQAETLIGEAEALDAVEEGRRAQRTLDDWFGRRAHAGGAGKSGRRDPDKL